MGTLGWILISRVAAMMDTPSTSAPVVSHRHYALISKDTLIMLGDACQPINTAGCGANSVCNTATKQCACLDNYTTTSASQTNCSPKNNCANGGCGNGLGCFSTGPGTSICTTECVAPGTLGVSCVCNSNFSFVSQGLLTCRCKRRHFHSNQ